MINRPVVFYDGACPLCSREIRHYRKIAGQSAIDWVDISLPAQRSILAQYQIDWTTAMKEIHVIDRKGLTLTGAYAFREMWLHLPYYRLLGRLLKLPLITPLLNTAYGVFARIRWRLIKRETENNCSGHCQNRR